MVWFYLLMMKENAEFENIVSSMIKVVENCVESGLDVSNISYGDLEHLFVSMRARSVGETIDIKWKCEDCGETFPISLNVSNIMPSKEYPKDTKVMLGQNIGVSVIPVPAKHIGQVAKYTDSNPVEILHYVIDSVFTDQGIHKFSDYDIKERVEFIESLSMTHVKSILEMVDSFPKCCIRETINCPACGHEQEIFLEGLENFFT